MGKHIHEPQRPGPWWGSNPGPHSVEIRGWTFVTELGGWRVGADQQAKS